MARIYLSRWAAPGKRLQLVQRRPLHAQPGLIAKSRRHAGGAERTLDDRSGLQHAPRRPTTVWMAQYGARRRPCSGCPYMQRQDVRLLRFESFTHACSEGGVGRCRCRHQPSCAGAAATTISPAQDQPRVVLCGTEILHEYQITLTLTRSRSSDDAAI